MPHKTEILHIAPPIEHSSGVSRYVRDVFDYFNISERFKLHLITDGGEADNSQAGLKVKPKIMKLHQNIFSFNKNVEIIERYCRQNNIKIIHTHHRFHELLATTAAKKHGIKTITTAHSIVTGKKSLSFRSDRIIAVSNAVRKLLTEKFDVPDEKIITLRNGVKEFEKTAPEEISALKNKLGIADGEKVLLFTGRLDRIKGIDTLIEAKRKLPADIRLILVGKITDDKIEKILRSDHHGAIILPAEKDIYKYYFVADAVILPSRTESLGYSMLESGVAGKVFVGGRTGGIEEFIEDGVNGLLFEPGNSDDLRNKIDALFSDKTRSTEMGIKLREKVMTECSFESYFRQLEQIYDELAV